MHSKFINDFETETHILCYQTEKKITDEIRYLFYNNQIIGNLSSVGYTNENNKLIALFLTKTDNLDIDVNVQVQCAGELYNAKVIA